MLPLLFRLSLIFILFCNVLYPPVVVIFVIANKVNLTIVPIVTMSTGNQLTE